MGIYFLALINGVVPFIVGFGIGYLLNYGALTSALIGIVFISSSIAVVVPSLEANRLFNVRIGRAVMTTSVIQDVSSLLLLSFLLQKINPSSNLPLILFYPLMIMGVVLLKLFIPKIKVLLSKLTSKDDDLFQEELRSVVLILVGTVIIFELLGLHSIIGGFFAGLVLSESITDKVLLGKVRAISYGVFIPTFFILVGINMHVSVLFEIKSAVLLTILIVLGSFLSKFLSGFLGSKIVKFTNRQSLFFGLSSIPQLSTTLAVSYTANKLELISDEVNTAFIVLSLVSTFLGPILMSKFSAHDLQEQTS